MSAITDLIERLVDHVEGREERSVKGCWKCEAADAIRAAREVAKTFVFAYHPDARPTVMGSCKEAYAIVDAEIEAEMKHHTPKHDKVKP